MRRLVRSFSLWLNYRTSKWVVPSAVWVKLDNGDVSAKIDLSDIAVKIGGRSILSLSGHAFCYARLNIVRTPPVTCSGCAFLHDAERCSYRQEDRRPTDAACVEYCPNDQAQF